MLLSRLALSALFGLPASAVIVWTMAALCLAAAKLQRGMRRLRY